MAEDDPMFNDDLEAELRRSCEGVSRAARSLRRSLHAGGEIIQLSTSTVTVSHRWWHQLSALDRRKIADGLSIAAGDDHPLEIIDDSTGKVVARAIPPQYREGIECPPQTEEEKADAPAEPEDAPANYQAWEELQAREAELLHPRLIRRASLEANIIKKFSLSTVTVNGVLWRQLTALRKRVTADALYIAAENDGKPLKIIDGDTNALIAYATGRAYQEEI